MEKISLTTEQLDALRELGNIGAGNGATALSQLLGRKVYISISRLQFMDLNDVAPTEFINDSNSIGIAFVLKMLGMLKGWILV
ncbi:MAG: chemotaxis protein CheC, partial [Candidatus Omnitrophica bacterium]|nr:chemotaxis protein CheC [Candidatus Omnitrophota bacterium]